MALFTRMTCFVFPCSLMVWALRETLIDLHREQNDEWGRRQSHRRYSPRVMKAGDNRGRALARGNGG